MNSGERGSLWNKIIAQAQEKALRAGAYGALNGGSPAQPGVGVLVPVSTPAELEQVLKDTGTPITLLVPTELARHWPVLPAPTRHEIAGAGPLSGLPLLEAMSGQAIHHWAVTPAMTVTVTPAVSLPTFPRLGLTPLPQPEPKPLPGNTVQFTPARLAAGLYELGQLGYQPLPVRDLPGLRPATPFDLFQHLYQQHFEESYARKIGMIDLAQPYSALLKVAPLDHAPAPLPLPRHTPTAELHFHSRKLVGLASGNKLATFRAAQRSLKDVARAMQTRPELAQAQAVFGVSLLSGPLEKMGFELLELPPLQARWYGLGFRLLRRAYGTRQPPSEPLPRMAWMPRAGFIEKFGK